MLLRIVKVMIYTVVALEDLQYLTWQAQVQRYNIFQVQSAAVAAHYFMVILYDRIPSQVVQTFCAHGNVILIDRNELPSSLNFEMLKYPALIKSFALDQFIQYCRKRKINTRDGVIFLIDPDVLFLRPIETELQALLPFVIRKKRWYSTNCSGDLGYQCLSRSMTAQQIDELCLCSGIHLSEWMNLTSNGGCQYIFPFDLPDGFCKDVLERSITIFHLLNKFHDENQNLESFLWRAEMISFHFQMIRYSIIHNFQMKCPKALNHLLADTDYTQNSAFILHLSGNMRSPGLFNKTLFYYEAPWHRNQLEVIKRVTRTESASFLYLTWCLRYVMRNVLWNETT